MKSLLVNAIQRNAQSADSNIFFFQFFPLIYMILSDFSHSYCCNNQAVNSWTQIYFILYFSFIFKWRIEINSNLLGAIDNLLISLCSSWSGRDITAGMAEKWAVWLILLFWNLLNSSKLLCSQQQYGILGFYARSHMEKRKKEKDFKFYNLVMLTQKNKNNRSALITLQDISFFLGLLSWSWVWGESLRACGSVKQMTSFTSPQRRSCVSS
jgi:hypothetical protein